jgi:hypothetical protein
MKVTGNHVVHAPPAQVWEALQDPAVLVRTIPGCQELHEVDDHTWTARVQAGVASIRGVYDGKVVLRDQDPPHSYTLKATGSGGPGTIDATAEVTLADENGDTRVTYDADAVVGGAIAGVGQRVITGVARRNAETFFDAVDRYLAGELEEAPAEERPEDEAPAAAAAGERAPERVYRAPERAAAPSAVPQPVALLAAACVGAAIALAGVLVGQRRRT